MDQLVPLHIGGALAGPLLTQAAGLLRRTEADAAAAAAAEAETRRRRLRQGGNSFYDDGDAVHVPGGGIDTMVLGRLLGTLGECAAAAKNAPDAAAIAGATLELVASPAVVGGLYSC
jgi:hypothetical protein